VDDVGRGASPSYRFGPYTLVPRERLLARDGVPQPLAPKLLDLLCLLVADAGLLVPRDRVIEAVWPDVFVSETSLRQKVWLLRKALKTPADGAEYIETVPRRGYRFTAPVTVLQPDPRSVALLRLRHHSGDPGDGWITEALTEMLRAELASSTGFRLVPAETVERHAADLSPPPVHTLSPQSLDRVRHLGGDWVVAGALVAAGSGEDAGLRVDLLVQCTKSREIIAAVTESGIRRDLTELAARAGHELRLALAAAQARGRSLP
jgi:DNA-binding winged helix-turn-helix (wHTH) protein